MYANNAVQKKRNNNFQLNKEQKNENESKSERLVPAIKAAIELFSKYWKRKKGIQIRI